MAPDAIVQVVSFIVASPDARHRDDLGHVAGVRINPEPESGAVFPRTGSRTSQLPETIGRPFSVGAAARSNGSGHGSGRSVEAVTRQRAAARRDRGSRAGMRVPDGQFPGRVRATEPGH